MTKMYTVYGLLCPDTHVIFYVGMSVDVERRVRQHKSAHWTRQGAYCEFLKSVGLSPVTVLFGSYYKKVHAQCLESRLIKTLPHLMNSQVNGLVPWEVGKDLKWWNLNKKVYPRYGDDDWE